MAKAPKTGLPPRGPLAPAEEAIARGDLRRGRALLRQALAADPAVDRRSGEELLARTGVDPAALGTAAAVFLVVALAAWFGVLHRAG
ncbi:MAG: hypothetical protein NVSMB23_29930 [Myxococcales bacterium]